MSANSLGLSTNLEVITPATADVEFKYTWPINGFLQQVKRGQQQQQAHCSDSDNLLMTTEHSDTASTHSTSSSSSNANGLDSRAFEINVNGVHTKWNLSIRFWTGEDGERLANPFVLCLNMLSCSLDKPLDVGIHYRFGVLNRVNGDFEMGAPNAKPDLRLETTNELRSVGYRNVAISEKHVNGEGDIQLVCKMRLMREDEVTHGHTLSADLARLFNDEKTADLAVDVDDGSNKKETFYVHKHILSARSPVFAGLLSKLAQERDGAIQKGKMSRLAIRDLKPQTVKDLLYYVYTDNSTVAEGAKANSMLAAADAYGIPGLKKHCEMHLGEGISAGNVASVLLMADRYRCHGLKKSALSYCKDNHSYIMKDRHWKTIEEEKPELFEEAVSGVVANAECECHTECLKKKGKRFEFERNSSIPEELEKDAKESEE